MNRKRNLLSAACLGLVGTLLLIGYVRAAEGKASAGQQMVPVVVVRDGVPRGATLPMRLGSALGVADRGVQASATATWVPRVRRPFVPIPIARCLFDAATNGAATTKYGYRGSQPHVVFRYTGGGGCGTAPGGLEAVGEEYGPFRADSHCNPPSGCSVEEMAPLIGEEVVVSVWTPLGASGTWRFDGFAGFRPTSFMWNNGHKVPPNGACSVNECLSGTFTRTSRRDGLPGAFVLGGQVDLVQ